MVRFKDLNPRIILANGRKISIQASKVHYCRPRQNDGPYTHYEVGVWNGMPKTWEEYGDYDYEEVGEEEEMDLRVYGYVPLELIEEYINSCGGIKEGKLP